MTKYDCVDCKRPVEIIIPEENICVDCYIVRLKLQIFRLSTQASTMQALLERWMHYSSKSPVAARLKLFQDTETLLKEAKEVKDG